MEYLLGLDIGSTTTKALIFCSETGKAVSEGRMPTEITYEDPDKNRSVWDPEVLWENSSKAIYKAISGIKNSKNIKGVAVTSLGMDGLPIDKFGEPLYPFISWHDTRTISYYNWWNNNINTKKIFGITGTPPMTISSINRIMWIKDNKPEIYRKTNKWLLIPDFINFKLTNKIKTDYTMASTTMAFDIENKKWSKFICNTANVNKNIFPEAFPSGSLVGNVTGEAAKKTGLEKNTPVFLAGHDNQCAGIAAGSCSKNSIAIIAGTWEMVFLTKNKRLNNKKLLESGYFCAPHVINDYYCIKGATPSAGAVEWFINEFGKEFYNKSDNSTISWGTIFERIKKTPYDKKLIALPYLFGRSCPVQDPFPLGAFVNLSEKTSKEDMFRALVESLNFQSKEILEKLENSLKTSWPKLKVVGGPSKSDFWMQNKADILNKRIITSQIDEATALGAAIISGVGADIYENAFEALKTIQKNTENNKYIPNKDRNVLYNKKYKFYKELYPNLCNIRSNIFDSS